MIGQALGHYRIEAQLGAGGMGVVYRAHDTRLERTVAVKLVADREAPDATARQRLLREAQAASALNHPSICTVHEVGESDGHLFIVMEHVEGRSLKDLIPPDGLPLETVIRYGVQIADALAHAHQRGIIHRDVKAGNVVITPEGRAKVLDFGLSKRLPTEDLTETPTRSESSLKEAGLVAGTLHYLAPEVLRGQKADARTDIWALGVLLSSMASGALPFDGKTRYEVTASILREPPALLPAGVPAGLRAVIQRCLAKDPSQRYQQANEVRAALETVQTGSNVVLTSPSTTALRRRALWISAAVLLSIAAAGLVRSLGSRREIGSVAVLPFVNVGGDPDSEYASDGIAESVIGSLSKLPRLKVIAFSSVTRYRGLDIDPRKVGHELNVEALVTGRLEQHGETLVIRADLVSASDGRELWGQKFARKRSALLSVQDDISTEISDNLRLSLSGEDRKRVVKHYTEDSDAYQSYLKGRYYHRKEFTPEDYKKALDYYAQAIEKDPNYALAYSGLSDLYASMAFEGLLPPKEAFEKAQTAVRKALELDSTLSEVHLSLAVLAWGYDWNWAAAEKQCRSALEINPNSSGSRFFCGQCLRGLGRFGEAIGEMTKAQELDPLSVDTLRSLGITYYWAHQYDQAIEQYRRVLELAPKDAQTHDALADVYARRSLEKEAIGEEQAYLRLVGDDEGADALGRDYQAHGYQKARQLEFERTLDLTSEAARQQYVSPIAFAIIHAKLQRKDEAFAWLEKAFDEHAPWLTYIKTDPAFDSLRSDPRFVDTLRRVGLPQ